MTYNFICIAAQKQRQKSAGKTCLQKRKCHTHTHTHTHISAHAWGAVYLRPGISDNDCAESLLAVSSIERSLLSLLNGQLAATSLVVFLMPACSQTVFSSSSMTLSKSQTHQVKHAVLKAHMHRHDKDRSVLYTEAPLETVGCSGLVITVFPHEDQELPPRRL